jgi:hypothetical protein
MDDNIDISPESLPESGKGEGGLVPSGKLTLTRSEMAVLARADNDFPISFEDRCVAVEAVMETMRTTTSKKIKLAAVRTLAVLDKANISRQRNRVIADKPPELPRQVVINYNNLSVDELLTMRDLMLKAGVVDDGAAPKTAPEAGTNP